MPLYFHCKECGAQNSRESTTVTTPGDITEGSLEGIMTHNLLGEKTDQYQQIPPCHFYFSFIKSVCFGFFLIVPNILINSVEKRCKFLISCNSIKKKWCYTKYKKCQDMMSIKVHCKSAITSFVNFQSLVLYCKIWPLFTLSKNYWLFEQSQQGQMHQYSLACELIY